MSNSLRARELPWTPAPASTAAVPTVADAAVRDQVSPGPSTWRWAVIAALVLFSALNFLDRQLLAAVAPSVMSEFNLNNAAYGTLLAAFSFAYMLSAPVAGLLVDRVGIYAGAMLAVGLWSLVGAGAGLAYTFTALVGFRMALGVAEAAGIPCSSKGSATYLLPREQGLGIAVQSIGFTLGAMAAPLTVAFVAPQYGWRAAFIVCGVIGFAWLPLWAFVARRVPAAGSVAARRGGPSPWAVLADRRLVTILIANVLIMTVHSMWMNWTTVYLVQVHGLTQSDANAYFAWIPPIFASLGGLFGAWLTLRATAGGTPVMHARLRHCYLIAPALLVTALVPLMPTPGLAVAAISLSFFSCMAMLNNLHVLPIDLFGPGRAAFTAALIVSSYAAMQTVLSPFMGMVVDRFGFAALCVAVSGLPIVAAMLLRAAFRRERDALAA